MCRGERPEPLPHRGDQGDGWGGSGTQGGDRSAGPPALGLCLCPVSCLAFPQLSREPTFASFCQKRPHQEEFRFWDCVSLGNPRVAPKMVSLPTPHDHGSPSEHDGEFGDEEVILDGPSGLILTVAAGGAEWERTCQEQVWPSQRDGKVLHSSPDSRGGRGPQAKGHRRLPDAGNGKEADAPQSS